MLDPFAGSGALFLEALSRGARAGLALDTNGDAVAALRNHLDTLKCGTGQLVMTDSLRYLDAPASQAFDLVFLDPPFHQDLLQDACRLLEERGWLTQDAWIYTESESRALQPRPARQLAAAPGKESRQGALRALAAGGLNRSAMDLPMSTELTRVSSTPSTTIFHWLPSR